MIESSPSTPAATLPMKTLLAICALLAATSAPAATPGEVPIGSPLRDAQLASFSGSFKALADWRGKPLIINVWASWCAPCRAEMGSLDRLVKRYGEKKFNVIGISTDDDFYAAGAFVVQQKLSFRNFHDRNLQMENMLGAKMIPLTVLVDSNGRVLKKIQGYREWDSPEIVKMIGETFKIRL